MADSKTGALKEQLGEWFLRGRTLRLARAALPRPDHLAARAFEQARLLREIARQVAEPIDAPPAGRPAEVLLLLYRDLVYWALVAQRMDAAEAAPDLAAAWEQTPSDRLLRAAGTAGNLAAVQRTLLDSTPAAALETPPEEVARVRAFAEALCQELEVPRRRAARIVTQRWIRVGLLAAAVVTLVLLIRAMALGPNLATLRPFRPSSTYPPCAGEGGCKGFMFHTNSEYGPWVEFDLAGTKPIRVVKIRNVTDCCQDRAIPLIVEISNDHVNWKELARRETVFTTWVAKFPRQPAAYVRLRTPRTTYLHLADVEIR